jgi:hypothetical protein
MNQADPADQPARGPDGQLLDASEIPWYNDPDDPNPIQSKSSSSRVQEGEGDNLDSFLRRLIFLPEGPEQVGQRSRPIRTSAGSRLAEAIAAEKLDEYGSSTRRFILPRDAKTSTKRKRLNTDKSRGVGGNDAIEVDTDTEDKTFAIEVSEGGCDDNSSDSDSDGIEIGNEEVCLVFS